MRMLLSILSHFSLSHTQVYTCTHVQTYTNVSLPVSMQGMGHDSLFTASEPLNP